MTRSRKISLSSAPFYASLLVVLALGLFVGLFWTINEYQAYQESILNIRQNFQTQYRVRVKEELEKVIGFIEYKRYQTYSRAEEEIRDKVQSAYTIASHVYRMHKDEKSVEELRSMVAEILRPIRWNNGRGYYFAGNLGEGSFDLFADAPLFENLDVLDYTDANGKEVFRDIAAIASDKGAGVYHYNLVKPSYPGHGFAQFSFVKYFEPFDWFIGAGTYSDDTERSLQMEILSRVQEMHFAQHGEVFGFRFDGTIICNRNERLLGRSIRDFIDPEGKYYGTELLEAGLSASGEGYIEFGAQKPGTDKIQQKLSYVRAYADWDWIFVTTMYMDAMETAIDAETATYQRISFRNVSVFIILFTIGVSILLLLAYFYSLKIKQGITLFTDFFRKAADLKVRIGDEDLAFSEFENLRRLANQMVDDRIQKKALLHRNELRLDTLLTLGTMEKQSFQEKYDFILHRIVQLSRSKEGYLALVNQSQSHLTLCSYMAENELEVARKQIDTQLTVRVEQGGMPGRAILERKPILTNSCPPAEKDTLYPYYHQVNRHLDVPIFNDGTIVLVAGVCNNEHEYDNSDIRQIVMLLEGMWLHVLKTCSASEMERLERQIIAVSEEERNNIGRDLHDDLGSHLSGVELLSKVLHQKLEQEAPERANQLGTIRDLIRQAIEKLRRLSRGLYPVHVNEQGLQAAIEELVAEVESLFRVQCILSYDNTIEWADKSVAPHIYYIIREAAFNAARHGRPETINIFLEKSGTTLTVSIIDDGKGFGDPSKHKGMGFHTMQYRAKAIGATLSVDSFENAGTTVTLTGEVLTL